jgi:carbon-monoxide dehydrogenase medium subunit
VKPPAFEYVAVSSVDEALAELADHGADARLLAGGQSLVAMLNLRLVSPGRLIDLNRVPGLAFIEERRGGVAIGAMARQRAVEQSALVGAHLPLLAEAMAFVGNVETRDRGTIGGSLAHADPAAELPAVALCLDALVTVRARGTARVVPARELVRAPLTTALRPEEALTEVWFPARPPSTGSAWLEITRTHGDYALVGVGATVTLSGDRIAEVRLALCGVAGAPVRASAAEALLRGRHVGSDALDDAADAVRAAIHPDGDVHASAEYRRHVAGVLAVRALRLAGQRAAAAGP